MAKDISQCGESYNKEEDFLLPKSRKTRRIIDGPVPCSSRSQAVEDKDFVFFDITIIDQIICTLFSDPIPTPTLVSDGASKLKSGEESIDDPYPKFEGEADLDSIYSIYSGEDECDMDNQVNVISMDGLVVLPNDDFQDNNPKCKRGRPKGLKGKIYPLPKKLDSNANLPKCFCNFKAAKEC